MFDFFKKKSPPPPEPIPEPIVVHKTEIQTMVTLLKQLNNAVAKNKKQEIVGLATTITAIYMSNPKIFNDMMSNPMEIITEYLSNDKRSFGSAKRRVNRSNRVKRRVNRSNRVKRRVNRSNRSKTKKIKSVKPTNRKNKRN